MPSELATCKYFLTSLVRYGYESNSQSFAGRVDRSFTTVAMTVLSSFNFYSELFLNRTPDAILVAVVAMSVYTMYLFMPGHAIMIVNFIEYVLGMNETSPKSPETLNTP